MFNLTLLQSILFKIVLTVSVLRDTLMKVYFFKVAFYCINITISASTVLNFEVHYKCT